MSFWCTHSEIWKISALSPNNFNIFQVLCSLIHLYWSIRLPYYIHMSLVYIWKEIGFMMDKILQGIKCSAETCINLFTCYCNTLSVSSKQSSVYRVPHFCGTCVFQTYFQVVDWCRLVNFTLLLETGSSRFHPNKCFCYQMACANIYYFNT